MAAIGVLAAEAADREELSLRLGELGHAAHGVARLEEAFELARDRKPGAFLIVDGGQDGELLARELLRAYPLLPVVAALKTRDAARAVALMRLGAAEVLAPPWTRTGLKSCVSKSLRWQGTALSPTRLAPPRRSAVWYALAVGLFLAAALGAAALKRAREARRAEAARVERWELPVFHPAGLAFDGKDVWVVDWYSQSLYAHARADARVVAERHLPTETPVAAVFAGDAVWTAAADGTVARRMLDAKLTALTRYPRAALNAAGLAFDGLYLWTLDGRSKVLSKRLADSALTVVSTHRLRDLKPAAVVWDGASLWTLDAGDRILRRHDLEKPEITTEVRPLPEYADRTLTPAGLAWDGGRFWTVAERGEGKSPALLLRHPAGDAR